MVSDHACFSISKARGPISIRQGILRARSGLRCTSIFSVLQPTVMHLSMFAINELRGIIVLE